MSGEGPGRPTVWTAETEGRFFRALELGLSINRAADHARVGRQTVYDRIAADEAFSDRLRAAESDGMVHYAEQLYSIADADPKTAAAVVSAAKLHLTTRGEDAWVGRNAIEHSGGLAVSDAASAALTGIRTAMASEEAGGDE